MKRTTEIATATLSVLGELGFLRGYGSTYNDGRVLQIMVDAFRPLEECQNAVEEERLRLTNAEEALRQICVNHLGFDPSDGEGTAPKEIVDMLTTAFKPASE